MNSNDIENLKKIVDSKYESLLIKILKKIGLTDSQIERIEKFAEMEKIVDSFLDKIEKRKKRFDSYFNCDMGEHVFDDVGKNDDDDMKETDEIDPRTIFNKKKAILNG